tara:strand:+ start:2736 stop:3059 length:324 start_codon:yes stop_codon:yes gene_type:complete
MSDKSNKPQQIKIEFDENNTPVEYCNLAVVTHSPAEFIIDYIRVLPGTKSAKVKSRIVMAPMHAKNLMLAMTDNIKKYEDKFGKIKVVKHGAVNPDNIKIPEGTLPN